MSSFFRSEEMALCQLFLQSETAYACVSELGELGLVQFRDLNPDVNAFQRKFVNEVRRCDEMERKLRFLEKEIKKDGIPMTELPTIPEAPQPRDMIDLEATFEKLENELKEVNQNAEALKRNFLELTELKHVLKKTQIFFDEHDGGIQNSESMTKALISDDSIGSHQPNMGQVQLGFLAGVILREKIPAFERMLWRACRGNVFLRQTEISIPLEDPSTGDNVYKCVFIIFFQGDQLRTRVKKICEGFRATLYPCPDIPVDRREMSMGVVTRIEDLNTVLGQTQDHRHRVLVAAAKNIKSWSVKVRKIKAIYHTLNLFNLDVTQKCLIAECWVPVLDIEAIQLALRRGTEQSGSSIAPILNRTSTRESPPTFNRTNKFTSAFQELVNAYGVSTYREVNPAQYAIITFPFLFAVMFGDIGHGLLLFLLASWMILKEKPLLAKRSKQEMWNILFGGRYVIFLMGLFAIYTGFLYNDIFSKSLAIFSSSWMNHYTANELKNLTSVTLNPIKDLGYTGTPYPIGFDPVWQLAQNKIIFQNSFKMKFSIVVGSLHMLFGLSLSLINHMFFRKEMNIFFAFIPQVLFFSCLFIYLSLLTIIKWVTYYAYNDKIEPEMAPYGPQCAPSILVTFINMFLFKENPSWGNNCTRYMYAGEEGIERLLMIIGLFCIPYLFIAKPYYYYKKSKNRKPYMIQNIEEGGQMVEPQLNHMSIDIDENTSVHDSEESNISEEFILNSIHSIEFILGTISHTASYLRLWALSLAHAQLSDVLWKMVLCKAFLVDGWLGGVAVYLIFMIWSVLTVCILVCMEGLSAFLHTLRLHWVEFQSKFYEGLGYLFQPFSFESIIYADQSSDD